MPLQQGSGGVPGHVDEDENTEQAPVPPIPPTFEPDTLSNLIHLHAEFLNSLTEDDRMAPVDTIDYAGTVPVAFPHFATMIASLAADTAFPYHQEAFYLFALLPRWIWNRPAARSNRSYLQSTLLKRIRWRSCAVVQIFCSVLNLNVASM